MVWEKEVNDSREKITRKQQWEYRKSSIMPQLFSRGSRASVSPSPIRLKTVTVMNIAKPGKIASHHAEGDCLANESSLPQVMVSAATPNPRKERKDSTKIAEAIPNAMEISTAVKPFGMACFMSILTPLNPRARAASMYSRLLTRNSSEI